MCRMSPSPPPGSAGAAAGGPLTLSRFGGEGRGGGCYLSDSSVSVRGACPDVGIGVGPCRILFSGAARTPDTVVASSGAATASATAAEATRGRNRRVNGAMKSLPRDLFHDGGADPVARRQDRKSVV